MKTFILFLALVGTAVFHSHAAIEITSWVMSPGGINFEISGTLDAPFPSDPNFGSESIYIGVPGDIDWITGGHTGSFGPSPLVDGITPDILTSTDGDANNGDYIRIATSGSPFDFTDGGSISLTGSVTAAVVPANLDPSQLIVTWGFSTLPTVIDAANQIGTSVVPEPSSVILVLVMGAASCLVWFRRR